MTDSHTRWARPGGQADDPERIAIREALAFGKALYDRRIALGLTVAELALRAGMTAGEIECIEEGGTEPTLALLRHLAADVRLTSGHGLGLCGVRNPRSLTTPTAPVSGMRVQVVFRLRPYAVIHTWVEWMD